MKIISKTPNEMYRIANDFLSNIKKSKDGATVVGLVGDLGSGKTTFVQGIASAFSVLDRITSPTFVIEKIYKIENNKDFKHLVHIDTYRLDNKDELLKLGFGEILKKPSNIVMIEWADKIQKILPKDAVTIFFKTKTNSTREISW